MRVVKVIKQMTKKGQLRYPFLVNQFSPPRDCFHLVQKGLLTGPFEVPVEVQRHPLHIMEFIAHDGSAQRYQNESTGAMQNLLQLVLHQNISRQP